MALVFALKLQTTGLVLLGCTALLTAWSGKDNLDWEPLLLLFSGFVICVSWVLMFVRFEKGLNRVLFLSPLTIATGLFLIWLPAVYLFLEAFRRESGSKLFLVVQGLWVATTLLAFYEAIFMLVGYPLTLIVFVIGCRRWQRALIERMDEFDLDDETTR